MLSADRRDTRRRKQRADEQLGVVTVVTVVTVVSVVTVVTVVTDTAKKLRERRAYILAAWKSGHPSLGRWLQKRKSFQPENEKRFVGVTFTYSAVGCSRFFRRGSVR